MIQKFQQSCCLSMVVMKTNLNIQTKQYFIKREQICRNAGCASCKLRCYSRWQQILNHFKSQRSTHERIYNKNSVVYLNFFS
jgi:enamine deaminase RidA (YjgF/YER057c/UK114 family)